MDGLFKKKKKKVANQNSGFSQIESQREPNFLDLFFRQTKKKVNQAQH